MDEHDDPDIELSDFKRHVRNASARSDLHISSPNLSPVTRALSNQIESVATSTLSWREKKNMFVLYSIYTIHALPLAFSWFSMPILLRQKLSYTLIGTYLISQYPYSVKVAWSPIVQSKYLVLLGRRKTWIVPCFLLGSLLLFWLGYHQDELISRTAEGEEDKLLWLGAAWFILTFLCSNIRIALDDWSLDLFEQGNVHWASPTVALAEISAGFFSFNLFLGLSSLGHPDAGASGEEVSTTIYFAGVGIAWLVIALLILLTQRDSTHTSSPLYKPTLRMSYTIILRILKLPQTWTLILVHMTSMIGFQTNDAIAILQLVKNGFTDRDIAGLATVSVPLELLAGVLVSKSFRTYHPLHVWRTLFPYRLGICIVTQLGVLLITHYRTHHWRWFIALFPYLVSKQFEDMMYIALISFHAQVADPAYGGIYLPLLATSLNIRYDTMGFIYTKIIGLIDGNESLGVQPPTDPAATNSDTAVRVIDGYQIVNLCAVFIAIPVFYFFLRPSTIYLQGVDRLDWRVGDGDHKTKGEYVVARNMDIDGGEGQEEENLVWGDGDGDSDEEEIGGLDRGDAREHTKIS